MVVAQFGGQMGSTQPGGWLAWHPRILQPPSKWLEDTTWISVMGGPGGGGGSGRGPGGAGGWRTNETRPGIALRPAALFLSRHPYLCVSCAVMRGTSPMRLGRAGGQVGRRVGARGGC